MLGDMSKKVKSSLYRKQIDEMLGDGVVARDISAWLKEQNPPESISKSLIYEYKGDHFDVEKEAVQQYSDLKSKERLDDAGRQRAVEIVKLQRFADMALDLELDLNIQVDGRTSKLDVEKHKLNVKKAGVQAQKIVNEFVKGSESPTLSVDVGLGVHERIEEYERRFRAARDSSDCSDGV
jgi:hypothetical protein